MDRWKGLLLVEVELLTIATRLSTIALLVGDLSGSLQVRIAETFQLHRLGKMIMNMHDHLSLFNQTTSAEIWDLKTNA